MKKNLTGMILLALGVSFSAHLPAYGQTKIPTDLTITLERTRCFGSCPAYTLTIAADGTVKFTPESTFAQRGDGPLPSFPLTGAITRDRLVDLMADFRRIEFSSLRDRYGTPSRATKGPSCPVYYWDAPSAIVTFTSNGKQKRVNHYRGCQGTNTLERLQALEDGIDAATNAEQWTSLFGWGAASIIDLTLSEYVISDSSTGKQIRVKASYRDPENDVAQYIYTVSGGKIIGMGAEVIWDVTGVRVGSYTITAAADDGTGIGRAMTKKITIN